MVNKAKELVVNVEGRAILFAYGSDGAPMLTRGTFASKLESGKQVVRRMGYAEEFLVQRALLKTTEPLGRPS